MTTYARIDGSKIADFGDLLREFGRELPGTENDYFGRDIDSFRDCLHGGYADDPPYVITVLDAEQMVEALGHDEARREGETLLQMVETVIWTAGSILALVFDASLRITRPIDCTRCGKRSFEWIGQLLVRNALTYYCSRRCPNCGGAMEADGGELHPELRPLVLAATGTWSLVVTGWSDRVAGMARLRKLCDLELAETNRRFRIGNSVAEGTKVEMVRLRRALADAGVSCDLRLATLAAPAGTPPHPRSAPASERY